MGRLWALLFPVFLLLGLRFGIFTPSEIGAFAVVYAVVIGMFAYRVLRRASLKEALEGSFTDVGSVMLLLALSPCSATASSSSACLKSSRLDARPHANADLVLILIVLFVLAAGTFIEGGPLIIMLTPIFPPLVTKVGVDPVHFGLIFVIAATIGNFTPPVGAALFAVCQILNARWASTRANRCPS